MGIEARPLEVLLYGFVTDSATYLPLVADLRIAGNGIDFTVQSEGNEGYYRANLSGEGNYTIKAQLMGYEPKNMPISVSQTKGDYYLEIVRNIPLSKIIQPYVVTGFTYDEKTGNAVSASVSIDLNDNQQVKVQSNEDGFYQAKVKAPGKYQVRATRSSYLNSETPLEIMDNQHFLEYNLDIYLKPIEIGVTVIIKNIYFDFDEATLKRESFPELERMVELMIGNPGITIEIAGHTDDKGSDEYNKELSQGRAEAVMNFLIDKGVNKIRMSAIGYGEEQPIATNTTEDGRAENRRVEFTILSK